jgi:L-lactate dehydrogenase complex protein LldF
VKIQIPELLIRNRAAQHDEHVSPRGEEFVYRMWSRVMRRPWLFRLAGKLGRWFLGWKAKDGWVSRLPGPLAGWTAHRDFPLPAAKSFRDRWRELEREEIEPRKPTAP